MGVRKLATFENQTFRFFLWTQCFKLLRQGSCRNALLYLPKSPTMGSQNDQMVMQFVQCPLGNTTGWHKPRTCRFFLSLLWGSGCLCDKSLPEPNLRMKQGEICKSHTNKWGMQLLSVISLHNIWILKIQCCLLCWRAQNWTCTTTSV